MSDFAYRLERVVCRRGANFRLRVDDLCLPRGEVTALVGPTGSGKTTLLRLLTGLVNPNEGQVSYAGQPLASAAELAMRQQIALVPQNPLLLRGSVKWNLEYGLRARGQKPGHRAEAVAEKLGIADLLPRDARSLSGGQTQLIALARAIIVEPRVLLLDEPTANLDPAYVANIERTVAQLHATQTTVVWSTHNLFQAKRVSQRTIFLLDGELIEVCPTAQFFENPSDARSRAFVRGELIC